MWVGIESRDRAASEIADVIEAVHRHRVGLCVWIVLVLCVAAGVLAGIKPQYGAATQLMLEQPARADDRADIVRQLHQLTLDDAQAQTQLHVILSERVLRNVFQALDLAQSTEASPDSDGPIERIVRWFNSMGAPEADADADPNFVRFRDRVHARRIGLTYVIEINYWAQDEAQALRVVNAVAAAYIQNRIEAVAQDTVFGSVPVKRRAERIQAEDLVAAGGVRAGVVPDTDFPDAAVRLLGAASRPADHAFPRPIPVLAMAFCFAVISGVLGVAMLTQMDRRIRSRRRLRTLAGLDAIAAMPRVPRSVGYGSARRRDRLWPLAVGAVRAAIGRSRQAEPQRRIGILGSVEGRGASRLAADLAHLAGGAEAPEATGPEATALRRPSREQAHMTILALPTLDASAEVQAELAAIDAAVLVIEADRTTVDEVGIALQALRDSNVALVGTLLTR